MDNNSPPNPIDDRSDEPPSRPDVDAQRERFRDELIAAAEEESAAIVAAARSEITVTVRRARRDLLLIRAQLQLCGLELPQLPTTEPDDRQLEAGQPTEALAAPEIHRDAEVPRDPILARRTHALLQVVSEAASELEELSTAVPASPRTDDTFETTPVGNAGEPDIIATRPSLSRPSVVAAAVLMLLAAGGVAVWLYFGNRSVAAAQAGRHAAGATREQPPSGSSISPVEPAFHDQSGADGQAAAVSPSRILVQTVRPVWMRIDVDGHGDTGRLYPAGFTTKLNPSHSLLIRAGDAGAVLMATGNGSMAALGSPGQVVTRRILVGDSAPSVAANQPTPAVPSSATTSAYAGGSTAEAAVPKLSLPPPVATPAPAPRTPPTAAAAPAIDPPTLAKELQPGDSEQHAEIFSRHSQWLDAYARSDQRAMAALTAEGFSLRDERTGRSANAPGTITSAQISDLRIDVAGAGAVLTARLRSTVDGVFNDSLLSEIWVRGERQQWALMGVRITPVDTVARPSR